MSKQRVDGGGRLHRAQRHSDGGRKLLLQLRLRLLEALQVPLSAGLCQRQQHRPCQPFISQWGDAGHQLWSEYGARWKILRIIGPFQLLTMAVRCWADKNVSSAADLHSPGLDGIVFVFIWFCPGPAETEQNELCIERNFNNLSYNSMDPAVTRAQQDTGGKSKPIVSYRGPKIARSTHVNMRLNAYWTADCAFTPWQCFYVPRCQKDSAVMHMMIMNISEWLKVNTQVPCYYDPAEQQETVLLTRLYDHGVVFHSLLWPSCMLAGGGVIIMMVKFTQYLSRLCEEIGKIKRWTPGRRCGDTWGTDFNQKKTKNPCDFNERYSRLRTCSKNLNFPFLFTLNFLFSQ